MEKSLQTLIYLIYFSSLSVDDNVVVRSESTDRDVGSSIIIALSSLAAAANSSEYSWSGKSTKSSWPSNKSENK